MTLMERRQKILERYYGKVNPLDDFELRPEAGSIGLAFVDRWVADGIGRGEDVVYRFGHKGHSWESYRSLTEGGVLMVGEQTLAQMNEFVQSAKDEEDKVFSVEVRSERNGHWGHWVRAYFYYNGKPATARLVGVEWDD